MRLQDYEDLRASQDTETLERRMIRVAHHMNFEIITAAVAVERPNAAALFRAIGNVPRGFHEASNAADRTKRDPVHQTLKSSNLPFSYSQATYVTAGAGDLYEEQAPYGFRTGVAIAQHLPNGRHFLLGVDRSDPLPDDDMQLIRIYADLQLLVAYAQEASYRLLIGPETNLPKENLTAREKEVLRWTREGKCAWAVGQILSISENSVNNHLRNACRKLDVSGKNRAVVKAIALGLI